ncbi:hypothetical protein EYF80_004956 [Liparis tanakae]|uniref:Uncharacterized protein n=1 Tax=Liparis tanakae TaxID=230148 RepID=A0A4Z2J4N9_9TELE|nr:hypothetical protein EYF80_004956 [Liparis tanakae]
MRSLCSILKPLGVGGATASTVPGPRQRAETRARDTTAKPQPSNYTSKPLQSQSGSMEYEESDERHGVTAPSAAAASKRVKTDSPMRSPETRQRGGAVLRSVQQRSLRIAENRPASLISEQPRNLRSKKCGSAPTALMSGCTRRNSSRARVPPFFTPMMIACGSFLLPEPLEKLDMALGSAALCCSPPPPRISSQSSAALSASSSLSSRSRDAAVLMDGSS